MHPLSVRRLASLLLAPIFIAIAPAQLLAGGLVVQDQNTPGVNPTTLAQSLAGAGVTISNVTYAGTMQSSGQFQGGLTIIGFQQGVILSSGFATDVIGPNGNDGTSQLLGTGGDPDLEALSGFITFDKTVLEFDFVPQGSTFTFDYVFASEEYNEYANTQYNDVFAFFVNGTNCATLPGTGQPVSINTINGGNPFGTNPQNPSLYRNNDPNDPGATIDTGVDGLTVVLTCTATVNPSVTNHIKLAIADASDELYDSYVFLRAQSFVSGELAIADASLPEAGGVMSFTVTRAGSAAQAASVDYFTADGTAVAPGDYAFTAGTLFFPAGSTSQILNVPIVSDNVDENDEIFFVNLVNPVGATITDGQAVGTIFDDDLAPAISVGDCAVNEGNAGSTPCNFLVTLSNPSSFAVGALYATADGTAVAPGDYTAAAGAALFPPGITQQVVAVGVVGDVVDENNETFTLNLSNPVGGTIADGQGVGTIQDDDAAPVLSVGDCAAIEGDAGSTPCVFNATLNHPSSFAVSANFATADGSATAGADYTPASGPLSFPPLSTSQPISVGVLGDVAVELDETFFVNLSAPTNATLGDAQGLGTILDDDAPSLTTLELSHGSRHGADLAGGTPDFYRLRQQALSSYEVTVDAASGDVAPNLVLQRLAADNVTVLQNGTPTAGGSSLSLLFENPFTVPISSQHIRVSAGFCGGACGPADVYRIRAWDTTLAVPRFNNSATQITVLVLHNERNVPLNGHVNVRNPAGVLLLSQPFTLAAGATMTLNTAGLPGLQGQSGSMTVTHDGPYGALSGKATAVEPATGFTFDTALRPRPR